MCICEQNVLRALFTLHRAVCHLRLTPAQYAYFKGGSVIMKHTTKLAQRIAAIAMSAALLIPGTGLFTAKETVKAADSDNYLGTDGNPIMLPQGYAASTIAWSYYEYKDVYDSLGLTSHFKTISKHFTDYFKKSTVMNGGSVSKFLYQKGDGSDSVDHGYWGAPEQQPKDRRGNCLWVTSGASEIAAEYAAALALDYINFNDAESLDYAKALYAFSTRDNQVAVEGTHPFYKSEACQDDQAWAAAWLYVATKDAKYLNDAKSKNTQYLGWAHAWGNVDLGAACIIAEQTGDWSKVNGYLGGKCQGNNYLCMDGWGSARYNCGMQFVSLVSSKHSTADYSSWA